MRRVKARWFVLGIVAFACGSEVDPSPGDSPAAALPSSEEKEGDGAWSSLFDEADAAVLLDLKPLPPEDH